MESCGAGLLTRNVTFAQTLPLNVTMPTFKPMFLQPMKRNLKNPSTLKICSMSFNFEGSTTNGSTLAARVLKFLGRRNQLGYCAGLDFCWPDQLIEQVGRTFSGSFFHFFSRYRAVPHSVFLSMFQSLSVSHSVAVTVSLTHSLSPSLSLSHTHIYTLIIYFPL